MKLGSLVAFGLVSSFVGLVACGSDEPTAAQKAQQADEALQEQFLGDYCSIILKCCNQILQKDVNDVAGCKAHLRQIDPVTIANKDARDACLTQARAAAPDPAFCKDFAQANTPACPDPSRAKEKGTKKPGEICNVVDDCAPDFTGIVDCAQGICQLRVHGAEGDGPCDTTIDGDVVLPLAEPSTDPKVFTCYRKGTKGTQCDSVSKTCIAPLADHDPCEDTSQCAITDFCDADEKRCFPKLPKDSKCSVDDECKGHCKLSTTGTSKGSGFCVDPLDADGDCELTSWCKAGLECTSGKCTAPGPDTRLAATCTP
jgi:hypothetical protein